MSTRLVSELLDVHTYGIDTQNREIFVKPGHESGEIDEFVAIQFITNLRILSNSSSSKPILVHFSTCGGSWEYGMGMYDAIASCDVVVVALMYSCSRSMSSIIPQAADHRIIMPNAYFMIHYGYLGVEGTHKSVTTNVKQAEVEAQSMLDIYVDRCQHGPNFQGKTPTQIKRFLIDKIDKKEDWFISPRETVEYGFMDAVLGDKNYESIAALKNLT